MRNSRLPDSLRGDLDSEVAACRLGAVRLGALFRRYGALQVEACFEAILARTTETFRRELLARIPDGTHVWEDYAEHDGVDPPRLHAQRITMTKTGDRLILDFAGTSPQARGPINHAGDYADGVFLKKWLAPILRNLADTPERMAELDVNEGVVPLIELRFPPPGTLLTPVFPAPTNARTFVILRLLGVLAGVLAKATGGRMPADQETIRYTGFHGVDPQGEFYLMREVLGGGSGGRHYADGSDAVHVVPDSKNLPVEFTETRFPLRVERLALATDSGGAGRRRGGLGYLKEFRPLADSYFLSVADRSILACWGLAGGRGRAAVPRHVDPGGPGERVLPGLVDDEPVPAGTLVRVETTGGGGWGDPLEREPSLVVLDVVQGKVSARAAREDYGVVLATGPDRRDGPRRGRHRGPAEPAPRGPRPARRSSIAGPATAASRAGMGQTLTSKQFGSGARDPARRPALEPAHRSARLWSRPLGSHVAQGRLRHEVSPVPGPIYGRMFWFSRKKFVGSYLRLSARSRSYLASP